MKTKISKTFTHLISHSHTTQLYFPTINLPRTDSWTITVLVQEIRCSYLTTISEGFKKHRGQELAHGLQALIVMNPIFKISKFTEIFNFEK